MFHRYCITTALLCGAVTSLSAQETITPMIVSATRTAQTADESLASVSVITRQDIEQRQPRDLADLLRSEAGIAISRNGGYGKTTSLFLRGTEARHVLVLIDGIRAAAATSGEFSWQNINPAQIERIEIIRGPRASLYGSDAIGGVIHIFTRRSDSYARVAAGSYNTQQVDVGIGGTRHWRYHLGAGTLRSDGFPTQLGSTEDHGYDNLYANFSLDGALQENLDLALKLSHGTGTSQHDVYTGDNDYTTRTASLALQHTGNVWNQSLTLGHVFDEYITYSPTYPATISTQRSSVSWQHDVSNALGLTSFGIDHWRDQAEKDNSGLIDATIDNTGLFLEHQWSGERHDLQLGVRQDRHDDFGTHGNWNIAWGMRADENTRLFLSYGTAFKAPTVNGLFWPYSVDTYFGYTFITQGNPALKAEESDTVELGLRHQAGIHDVALNLYHTATRNMIEWSSTQTGPTEYTYQPVNRARVTINGMELTGTWQLSNTLQAGGALTLLDAQNEDTGEQLDRRPQKQLVLHSTHQNNNHTLRGELLAVGERLDNDGATRLAGYSVLNLSYLYRLSRDMSMDLRMENLSDRSYILAQSYSGPYATPGRSFYLGFTYRPQH